MSRKQVLILLTLLCAFNALFILITYPDFNDTEARFSSDRWVIEQLNSANSVNLNDLVGAGFWGQLPTSSELSGAPTEGEAGALEAKSIRQSIKGIITRYGRKNVLFESNGVLNRYEVGDTLPDSTWVIANIELDSIKLSKIEGGIKELRLFDEAITSSKSE